MKFSLRLPSFKAAPGSLEALEKEVSVRWHRPTAN